MSVTAPLKAPVPFFGGKARAASLIWSELGDVPSYVEPFCGSAAVLLARPHAPRIETINDTDGFITNLYRALKADPDSVAYHADAPVHELDLTAKHAWLVDRRAGLTKRLEADPDFYDPKMAGWWTWGACCWIGSGWCTGEGPWRVVDGELVKAGQGVNKQLPHLSDAGQGVNKQLPKISRASGGLMNAASGSVIAANEGLYEWFRALSERLRRVRVTCGDFNRVLTPSVTTKHGLTGVFLDPPYDHDGDRSMYAHGDTSSRARAWALENGTDPLLRIVLAGYGVEHDELLAHGWRKLKWGARKGYQKLKAGHHSGHDESLWCSPNCLHPAPGLFEVALREGKL